MREGLSGRLPEFLLVISIIVFIAILLILENSGYSYSNYLKNLDYNKIKDLVNLIVTTDGFIIAFTGVIASTVLRNVLEKEEKGTIEIAIESGEKRAEMSFNYYRKRKQQIIKFVLFILFPLIFSIGFSLGVIITQCFFYTTFSIIFLLIGLVELVGMIYYSLSS